MKKWTGSMNVSQRWFAGATTRLAKWLWPLALLGLWTCPSSAHALHAASAFPAMAPVARYMMAPAAEIALARSAAPASVSDKAEVLVLGAHGYKTAVKGTNGFVCYVGRSWENDIDDANFWDPKQRAPECDNAVAARSVLPYYLQRTRWVLAGVSRTGMVERTKTGIAAKQIMAPEIGAMCFMLSKEGYLSGAKGPWHPHVMFYGPPGPGSEWGADLPGSPVLSHRSDLMPVTIYFVPVRKWSNGTLAQYRAHP
ncbi:MAG: hypothetical protein ACREPU_05650 [Rhodanobacteraceae bacterium]